MSAEPNGFAFAPDQRRALACVLDLIVPPSRDGSLPGAGQTGAVDAVERFVARTPELAPAIAAGLGALDDLARGHGATSFAALAPPERAAVLDELAAVQPGFVPSLLFPTYVGYYQAPRVLEGLGLEARPPFPKGHPLAPLDEALLESVRRRAPFWRKA
jgi:hypothetical protein